MEGLLIKLINNLRLVPILSLLVKISCAHCAIHDAGKPLQLITGEIYEYKLPSEGAPLKVETSDPAVIKTKWSKRKGVQLIKGLKEGKSDLNIRLSSKETFHLSITVSPPGRKNVEKSSPLNALGLQTQKKGSTLFIRGNINSLSDLKFLREEQKKRPHWHFNVCFSDKLKQQILTTVRQTLAREQVEDIDCEFTPELLNIYCFYNESTPLNEKLEKNLQQVYGIQFFTQKSPRKSKNFVLKLKLLQMEKQNGDEFTFGLHQLDFKWNDYFQRGAKAFIEENEVLLREDKLSISTLAEPELIVLPEQTSTMEVGTQKAFAIKTSGNRHLVDWKFAGLKISLDLHPVAEKVKITYSLELTSPSAESISGSKETGELMLELKTVCKIFELGLQTEGEQQAQIPILGDLPFIGKLFTLDSKRKSYKRIYGLLLVEEKASV